MKQKRLLSDPGFWMLLGVNIYLIYYYYQHPEVFTTLIWLYWLQSVTLGIFNFFDMLTVRKAVTGMETLDRMKNIVNRPMKRASAFFFIVHYGLFHLVYLIFIAGMKRSGLLQWDILKYGFLAFLAGQTLTFIQHKRQQRYIQADVSTMFFTPYLRVIPMHLTIILPKFLAISNLGIFIILKGVADIAMYVITKISRGGRETDATLLATRQTMDI